MKKRLILIIAMSLFVSAAAYTRAHAVGFGAYGSFSGGKTYFGKISLAGVHSYVPINTSTRSLHAGGGFVIDTNCADDRLFNYRFNAGMESVFLKSHEPDRMARLTLSNTFGFGLLLRGIVRLWLGPQVGIDYLYGTMSPKIDFPSSDKNNFFITPYINRKEYAFGGLHLGIVLGLNINIGDLMTLSLDGGARYFFYYGLYSSYYSYSFAGDSWIPASGYEGFASLAVLYRVRGLRKQRVEIE